MNDGAWRQAPLRCPLRQRWRADTAKTVGRTAHLDAARMPQMPYCFAAHDVLMKVPTSIGALLSLLVMAGLFNRPAMADRDGYDKRLLLAASDSHGSSDERAFLRQKAAAKASGRAKQSSPSSEPKEAPKAAPKPAPQAIVKPAAKTQAQSSAKPAPVKTIAKTQPQSKLEQKPALVPAPPPATEENNDPQKADLIYFKPEAAKSGSGDKER